MKKEMSLEEKNLVTALKLGIITWFDYLERYRNLKGV